jgi:hypothetical protein
VIEAPSYTMAFLRHRWNQALVVGLGAFGVLLSFPFGGEGFVGAMLLLAAVETVGVAIVPMLPPFRAAVDKQVSGASSQATRARLLQEIDAQGGSPHVESYRLMCDRVASLHRTALDRSSALSERDIASLDQLTIDYLRMCLSDAALRASQGRDVVAEIERKLKGVQQRLQQQELSADEAQQLKRAQAEYQEALARQARMQSRRSSLEAQLIAMPLRMEEVYQMVMTSPGTGDLRELLDESVSKLRIAEEVALDVDIVSRAASMPDRGRLKSATTGRE